jgi:nitrite reductase/ring-hydroxylating ferredoxin subunit
MMKKILFLLLFCLVAFACNKQNTRVPLYPVEFYIRLSDYDSDLMPIGSAKEFTSANSGGSTGYLGVWVYHSMLEEFTAFDRACPNNYCLYTGLPIVFEGENLRFKCNNCGTTFDLQTGFATGGTTYNYSLRQYRVFKENDILYHVTN